MEEIKSRPEIDIEWRPVESHPLPEDHPPSYLFGGPVLLYAREFVAPTQ